MLGTGKCEIGHDVEAVAPAGGPARHHADHDLGHEPDESLHLEDVEPSGAGGVDGFGGLALGVAVAVAAADALIAAGAERPTAVLGGRTVAGEQHAADIAGHAGMVENSEEFIDGAGAEGVADLGAIEGHPHRPVVVRPVVGDVGEVVETGDDAPCGGVEDLRDHSFSVRNGRKVRTIIAHGTRHAFIRRNRPIGGTMFGKRCKAENAADRLRPLEFFEGFSDADLDRVGELAADVEADTGSVIIDQGRVGQECYIIESGYAGVYVADEHIVTLGPGSMVGEMALIDRRPRTATVVAESPIRLLEFDTKAFRQLLAEMPMAEERVLRLLADRIKANQTV